jgi:23S rRNA (cytosine1962-C5)-methyltransferase
MIILDPPALAKRRRDAGRALGLYHALNRDALAAISPGGWLFTSSCSHFVGREDFLEMLKRASTSARRRTVLVELNGAAPDHPVLMAMPETGYLKCAVLRVE